MLVFPMSGLSSRFSKAGYLSNKYKLDLYGNSVFHHIVSQFRKADLTDSFVFIHNGNDFDENFISQTCNDLGLKNDEYHIVRLNGETRGQAETVFKGIENINFDKNERLIIYNIDSIRLDFNLPKEIAGLNVDGYLEVFEGEGDHWSFALPKDKDSNELFLEVEKVAEKQRISKYCSNGLYYFKSFNIFKDAYKNELEKFDGKGELFVAPLYNNLIKNKKNVYMRILPTTSTVFCGTPDEYESIISASIPNKLEPSEDYIANKILDYAMEGVSQKSYNKMMELLVSVSHSELPENISNSLNIFYSHYSSYDRSIDYAFLHTKGPGKSSKFSKTYVLLQNKLIKFFKNYFYVQKNYPKALNIACIIVLMGHKKFITLFKEEFQELLHYIKITAHHSFFRIIKNNKINGLDFPSKCFSKISNNESVSYLFMVFCAYYNHKDNSDYFSYIQEKLSTSYECENDDRIRKNILMNYFYKLNEKRPVSTTKPLIRVAVLVSGQIRDCSFMAEFLKTLNIPGIEFDLYLSTWKDAGSPPPHLNSLRGYDPSIRQLIRNRSIKYEVSNHEFASSYHLRKDIDVDAVSLSQLFGELKWLSIDTEGESTETFNTNQERMFFQIAKAYKKAKAEDYDVYIRTRPDLVFNLDRSYLQYLILECSKYKKLIYVKNHPLNYTYLPFIDDNFAICSPDAMNVYAGIFDDLKNDSITTLPLFNDGKTIKQHSSLAYNLLMNNIQIDFIKEISEWKLKEVSKITASEYVDYLKNLKGENLNTKFIKSVNFKLRDMK